MFAAQYPRTEEGWIQFPRDIERRKKAFPDAVFNHPAKMNLFLVEALVDYVSVQGDFILDPFGGTGSTAIAAQMDRNVILIDVEDEFLSIMEAASSGLIAPAHVDVDITKGWWIISPDKIGAGRGQVRIVKGDNRQVLPGCLPGGILADAVITSPPYSSALKPSIDPLEVRGREGSRATYSKSALNMGNLNPFMWEQAMKQLWEKLAISVRVGGKIVMVNKDVVKSGGRELLSTALIRGAKNAGLAYSEWFKWKTPGTIRTETNKNKGGTVIEDEDIIVFERRN